MIVNEIYIDSEPKGMTNDADFYIDLEGKGEMLVVNVNHDGVSFDLRRGGKSIAVEWRTFGEIAGDLQE